MDWDCDETLLISGRVILPCIFSSRLLAVDIDASNLRDSWYNAGYLVPFVEIDGIKFYDYDKAIKLKFGGQLIDLPFSNYRLRFDPTDWLKDINIRIKQLASRDYLNMSGTAEIPQREIGSDTPISTALSIASVEIAPEDLNRVPGGNIINTSNRVMWFNCKGQAANKTHPDNIPIPAGGNYDIPSGYTGAITAIWVSNGTGGAVVHTSSYI